MSTTVVNIRKEQCTKYVGRDVRRRPDLIKHPLSNPFRLNKQGDNREEVLAKYHDWLKYQYRHMPKMINGYLDNLRGHKLGCWCKPLACHADVLATLADMTHEEREEWFSEPTQTELAESFRRSWRDALTGRTMSIDQLWNGIDES